MLVLLPVQSSFAQLSLGEPAIQKSITVTINEQGKIHVEHKILESKTVTHLETINGTVSNLQVTDEKGNSAEHGITGLEKIEGVTIFPSNIEADYEDEFEHVIIEYDLTDVLFLKNGMWIWDFFYLQTTTFIFPERADLVYVNSNPVLLQDAKGITCHGCDALIEYVVDEQIKIHQIQWENRLFDVGIRTTEISLLNFDQPTKNMSFNLEKENQLVTLIIPLELLWNPYEVFLDDKKILKHEFFSNETHSGLSFRPETSGTVTIIGTTVIPEFPIIAPLFIGIAVVIALQLKNKFSLH